MILYIHHKKEEEEEEEEEEDLRLDYECLHSMHGWSSHKPLLLGSQKECVYVRDLEANTLYQNVCPNKRDVDVAEK